MDYGGWLERAMKMDDAAWKRHANPWSGWTRTVILPLLAVALWSRIWIGWWCLLLIALLAVWTFVNPRAFPAPQSTDHWMSKATFGERVWLNRKRVPIPDDHAQAAHILSALGAAGMAPLIYGLIVFDLWAVICGVALVLIAKLWFLDRMVWLYEDMKDTSETYRSWLY